MSTATWRTSKQSCSLIRCFNFSIRHNLPSTRHHSWTRKNAHALRPARTAVRPVRRRSERVFHNVRGAGGELDNERRPRLASSTMEMDKKDVGKAFSRQHITLHQRIAPHRAMIALGSNIGDRVSMIEQACEMMPVWGINVKATSLLYETAPMYVTDQDAFYNGVCEVRSCRLAI